MQMSTTTVSPTSCEVRVVFSVRIYWRVECQYSDRQNRWMNDETFGYNKLRARWVPKMLTNQHKEQRFCRGWGFLNRYWQDSDDLFSNIIKNNETWISYRPSLPKPKKFFLAIAVLELDRSYWFYEQNLYHFDWFHGAWVNNYSWRTTQNHWYGSHPA